MVRMIRALEMGDLGPLGISKPVGTSSSPRWALHPWMHAALTACALVSPSLQETRQPSYPSHLRSPRCYWAPGCVPHDVDLGVKPHPKDQLSYPCPPAHLPKRIDETPSLCFFMQHPGPSSVTSPPQKSWGPSAATGTSHWSSLLLLGQSHYGKHH